MCMFSCLPTCVTPWTTACQAALSMVFCRPERWSGLQFPPLGDLPHPRIEPKTPVSSALAGGPLSHFERLLKDLCCAVLSHSVVPDSWETLWTVAHQGPLYMGILQARILQWVVMASSRASSQLWDQTHVSLFADVFFTIWATKEACEFWSG